MSSHSYPYRSSMTLVMLVLFALLSFKGSSGKQHIKWAVQKTSSLKIEGSSNINKFTCDVTGYYQTDTISFFEETGKKFVPLKGSLTIDVSSFDCHNRMLTKDLRKTLKSAEHPTMMIRFVSLERVPVFQQGKDNVKGIVEIELAGVCKRFEIGYLLQKNGKAIFLDGERMFSFSDFGLTPPKKLGGAVRVKNNFDVHFHLNLQQV